MCRLLSCLPMEPIIRSIIRVIIQVFTALITKNTIIKDQPAGITVHSIKQYTTTENNIPAPIIQVSTALITKNTMITGQTAKSIVLSIKKHIIMENGIIKLFFDRH